VGSLVAARRHDAIRRRQGREESGEAASPSAERPDKQLDLGRLRPRSAEPRPYGAVGEPRPPLFPDAGETLGDLNRKSKLVSWLKKSCS
jgi:hypothetical protein